MNLTAPFTRRCGPVAVMLFAGLALIAARPVMAQQGNDGLAAKVNGVGISQLRFDRAVDGYLRQRNMNLKAMRDPDEYGRVRMNVLDILIDQELLWQHAQREGIVVSDDEVEKALEQIRNSLPSEQAYHQRISQSGFTRAGFAEDIRHQLSARELIRREITPGIEVSEDEIAGFFAANRERMVDPEQVRARHILVKVDPGADDQARAAARERIGKLLEQARRGEDFAELAKQHSEGPSAERGGDLGFFTRAQMVPPFADAAFALQPGQISDVVQTRFGYHIIKLEERRAATQLELADVSERIRRHLSAQKVRQAVREFVVALRNESEVEVFARP